MTPIAFVRLILIGILLVFGYLIAAIALFGQEFNEEPLTGWRRVGKNVVAEVLILAHFIGGFISVKVKGHLAKPSEAPIVVVAPHTSFFDILPFCKIGALSVVGKAEMPKTPLIGKMLMLTQPILVQRESKDSRKETIGRILERAKKLTENGQKSLHSQIFIFPEATCTNQKALITFKPGAFYPKLPVQPIVLKWGLVPDTIPWTYENTNPFLILWYTLCNPVNHLEIVFMDVYNPNEEEKENPLKFAENVRKLMGKELNLPLSNFALDDVLFLSSNFFVNRTKFFDQCKKIENFGENFSTKFQNLDELIEKWEKLKESELKNLDFQVNFDDFSKYLRIPATESLRRLFNMFDWNCKLSIDLREFLLAFYGKVEQKNFFDVAFSIFLSNEKIYEDEDLVKILRFPAELSIAEAKKIFHDARKKGSDQLSKDDLLTFLRNNSKYNQWASISTNSGNFS